MTWTYDDNLLEQKDQVRFLVGDTDDANQLVQNEEIAWTLTEDGNIYSAAALVAETIAGRFANQVDRSIGDLKLRFSDRAARYVQLAKDLRRRVLLSVTFATTGAESKSSKQVDRDSTDLVQPLFTRDMHSSDELPNDLRDLA